MISFKVKDYYKVYTPIAINKLKPNPEQASKQDIYIYQKKVRSILYIANITKLDAVKIVSKLSKFLYNLSLIYNAATIRVIIYLYQTKTLAIKYSKKDIKNYIFIRASNTAFSNNLVSRKSTKGYLFTLYRGPIDQRLTK